VHVASFGKPLGLTEQQLHSTVHGTWTDPCWDAQQAAAFRLSDELHETSTLSDELWEDLVQHFDQRQILELIVTAGWYHVIGYVCNGARIELEEWAPRFPPR
jgi:alkylhydroperoxidase family enzyme